MMPEPEVNSTDKTASATRRFGIHIYLYLLIAILLLCLVAFMAMGFLIVDLQNPQDWVEYALPAAYSTRW
jgi:hypothetical protein